MTSLKELKALAEAAHQQFEVWKAINKDQLTEEMIEGSIKFQSVFNPQQILTLLSALEKYEEALEKIYSNRPKYAEDRAMPYEKNRIEDIEIAKEALTQVQKIMEGKYDNPI